MFIILKFKFIYHKNDKVGRLILNKQNKNDKNNYTIPNFLKKCMKCVKKGGVRRILR